MSRQIKREQTKLEKLIRTTWSETQRGKVIIADEQANIVAAIHKTLDYFEMHDYLNNENALQIIEAIYLSSSAKVSKIKAVAFLPYSESTIKRRCSEFIRAYEKNFCDIEKSAIGSKSEPPAWL